MDKRQVKIAQILKIKSMKCLTVFENHRESLIQNCERSELRLHFECTKVNKNTKNGSFWRVFENLKLAVKQSYQTSQI